MIELRTAYLDCELVDEDFTKVITHISQTLYKPIMHSMHYLALEVLGSNKVSIKDLHDFKPPYQQYTYTGGIVEYEKITIEGEVFKHSSLQKTFFFLIYGPAINILSEGKAKTCKLEIGIITSENEDAFNLLVTFREEVNLALQTISKLKNHVSFKWLSIRESVNFENFKWYKESNSFGLPSYTEQELVAALLMRDKNYRNQIREIGQAGFAREQDIFSNGKGVKSDKGNELIVKTLAEHGLLRTQGLLQCRRRQTPLMRLEEPEQMENETVRNLKCGLCGALYKDELIVKGYSLSDLGKKLMVKSHWMTIVLTDCLLKEGIDEASILWNITDANEEVDLIVGKNGQLWVFELKDRDFSAGDAYALNYRRSRFNANKPIVFTTDKVSLDAKRIFEDIEKEVSANVKDRVIPLYIEGFNELEFSLAELISEAVFQRIFTKFKSLSEITRCNLLSFVERDLQIDLSKFDVDDDSDNDLPF